MSTATAEKVCQGSKGIIKANYGGVKIYLASPFFNDEQIWLVAFLEKVLSDNETVGEIFSPRLQQLDHLPFGTPEWSQSVFQNDVKHIDWADVVVAVIDFEGQTVLYGQEAHNHVDSGTAFEIGYAYATNKPVVLVHMKGGIVNLMLSESATAYVTWASDLLDYDFKAMPEIKYSGGVL